MREAPHLGNQGNSSYRIQEDDGSFDHQGRLIGIEFLAGVVGEQTQPLLLVQSLPPLRGHETLLDEMPAEGGNESTMGADFSGFTPDSCRGKAASIRFRQ